MASLGSSDQSLLSRLNALKPSNINLALGITAIAPSASSTNTNGPDKPSLEKQPVSREDALAERLRILRNQPESSTSANSLSGTSLPSCTQPRYPATVWQKSPKEHQHKDQITPQDDVESKDRGIDDVEQADDDYLQYLQSGDPEQTLDDLLEGLDEFDLDGELDGPLPLSEFNPSGKANKLSDLLERFQKHKAGGGVLSADGHAVTGKVYGPLARGAGDGRGHAENEDGDDSEDEQMTHDVESILSQLRDEMGVAEDATRQEETTTDEKQSGEPRADEPDSLISLPNVPASPPRDLTEDPTTTKGSNQKGRKSFDFENDIVARMASLKGLGSTINVDDFGLPVAPTFFPRDHQGSSSNKAKGAAGYTDEDQKTWCIVCLDDATIRCLGCDDDVYCARCWKEMHMGPSSGYDERGHTWVKFER